MFSQAAFSVTTVEADKILPLYVCFSTMAGILLLMGLIDFISPSGLS